MEEYRERDDPTALSVKEQEDNPLNAWQLMVAEFDAKLADGKSTFKRSPAQQSVQDEYAIYVMGALSAGSTFDTLGFWKVRYSTKFTVTNHISYKFSTDS
jgi:hypothetical protein